ncbi:ead/Ea22-like family protein [Citrobacter freundii]|nr:ead/Ea22-like family protein [Citrobacter freundii]
MTAFNKQALREQIESAADAYWQFDNGWISDMKCGDLSHEYLLFVKEPKNVLALLDELEAAENNLIDSECHVAELEESLRDKQELLEAAEKRIAELEANKGKPVMFIDGDISASDAEKLAEVIREMGRRTSDCSKARTVTLPDVEKWRSVDAVRAQNAYKVLVSKVLAAAGIGVKGE